MARSHKKATIMISREAKIRKFVQHILYILYTLYIAISLHKKYFFKLLFIYFLFQLLYAINISEAAAGNENYDIQSVHCAGLLGVQRASHSPTLWDPLAN
jgi:hypothetical protein